MRILYIARHGQANSNDDEGAISYALEQLGHEVIKCQESNADLVLGTGYRVSFDLCLFHKWGDTVAIQQAKKSMPCVFWYFDLVDWPLDATLSSRCEHRKRWMAEVTPLVDLGFLSDGDWQSRDTTGKLHVLRQGADERVVGFGTKQGSAYDCDVLFVGGVKGCGVQRESFVKELRARYGKRFLHVEKGVYGRSLANLVASAKVVVCPDSPVTDRYWSNRVYMMAGFGACLFHPRVEEFVAKGMVLYDSRDHLYGLLDAHLEEPQYLGGYRTEILEWANKNLYRHRCEELVLVVKEKLGI